MDKKSFLRRSVGPALLVLIVMTCSWAVYMLSPKIPNFYAFQFFAVISGVFYFISLGFGAFYVYYVAYRGGAGPIERIVAALISPFIWMTKEVVIIASIYTLPEALYYYINPIHTLLIAAAVAEMGVADMLVRRRLRKEGAVPRALTFPAVTAVVLGAAWIVVMFAWGLGVHHFYIFQEGFKALFGYGAGL
jgi:hypothetical protein